jgi:YVTN family beta-propeller protein
MLARAVLVPGALLAITLPAMTMTAAADPSGTLVVANRPAGTGSVSLIDLDTGAEIARLPIGPTIPHELAVSPDGRYAVTGEYGGNDAPGRRVVVIDIVAARIKGTIDLGPMSRPHSFAFLPDSRRVVATMEQSDRIALIDIERLAQLRTFPTGGREGHMVRVSPDGAEAYVASRGAEGTLSIIALREDLPPTVIPTGAGAEGLAVSPDGTEVWVVNRDAGTISIVNPALREVVATLPVRLGAGRAAISAGGRVLVPNGGSGRAVEKYLTVYDVGSRRMLDELPMTDSPGQGGYSIDVVGELAFVADRSQRSIAIYDLTDLSRQTTIATDRPDPDGLAYSPRRVAVFNE